MTTNTTVILFHLFHAQSTFPFPKNITNIQLVDRPRNQGFLSLSHLNNYRLQPKFFSNPFNSLHLHTNT